ncbi:Protein MNN4 [Cladobotryum mycophilum]|uniref:Protein MNN4 n=1 Tax=Cladobotryum mycophilum TaxID=491253 RepID=A0ABR0T072_9HYPO
MISSSLKSLILLALATFSAASPAPSIPNLQPRDPPPTPKYFSEPGGSLALSHYDLRYFKDQVPYDEHRIVLRDLIRSYLTTMHAKGVETWIAHGTLLGWWWNGRIMPWDYDLDVQVANTTMAWLAANLNSTQHTQSFTDEAGATVSKTYLMDINPHHVDITRGDGMNIIDARWIDTSNGMFVDITVLREREPARPGVWSCKNHHRYPTHDLWPMRITEFEGVQARVPYSFEKILSDEYGAKSLVTEEFAEHRWDHDIQEWVKMSAEDVEKSRAAATERKKQELEKQGRLT